MGETETRMWALVDPDKTIIAVEHYRWACTSIAENQLHCSWLRLDYQGWRVVRCTVTVEGE